MRFINGLIYSIGGLIVTLALIALLLPSRTSVERSITIDASHATVFALLNDFHQINKWSNFLEEDPNARIAYQGPRRGAGSSFAWDGNIVGKGSQTIRESIPFQRIAILLEYDEENEAESVFDLTATEDGTLVVWSFNMDVGFDLVARYVGLIVSSVIGDNYEKGLESLKSMAEGLPGADFSDVEIEHIVVESMDIAYQKASSPPEAAAISEAMGKAYFEILRFIDDNNLREAGAPLSISREFSGSEIRFDAAIPVRGISDERLQGGGFVKLGATYEGPVIRVRHLGPYRTLGRTHDKIAAYLAALGIERNGDAWESYVSDPTRTEEGELLTFVYYPIVVEDMTD